LPEQLGVACLEPLDHQPPQGAHHLDRHRIVLEHEARELRRGDGQERAALAGTGPRSSQIPVEQRHLPEDGARAQLGHPAPALEDFDRPSAMMKKPVAGDPSSMICSPAANDTSRPRDTRERLSAAVRSRRASQRSSRDSSIVPPRVLRAPAIPEIVRPILTLAAAALKMV
jgi:hypothetical protein